MSKYEGLPEWLTSVVLSNVLRIKHHGKNLKITSVEKRIGKECAGDHYLSEITHFTVKISDGYSDSIDSFVIKDASKGLSDFILEVSGIDKEVNMYEEVLVYVNRALKEKISPEMYYVSPEKCILLEDLFASGYLMKDRMALLDFDHSKVALSTLAKFHAASVKLNEESPHCLRIVGKETAFIGNKDCISYYFGITNLQNTISMLRGRSDGHQFIEGINQFSKTYWDDINYAISADYGLKVLNHGDFWTTNILYRYSGGNITDCMLVDFQLTRFSAPTLDIHQFISMSIQPSVRDNYLPDLLNVYVTVLNQTLKELGSSFTLSFEELDKMMDETKVFGLLSACTLSQIALCDPKDPLELAGDGVTKSDFRQGFPKGDPYEKAYRQKSCQNHIISLLQFYKRKNYI